MNSTNPITLPTQYQQFIHLSRYARWDYDKKRRETWGETVNRYFDFFQEHLKDMCKFDLENGELEELKNRSNESQCYAIYEMFDDSRRCITKREYCRI